MTQVEMIKDYFNKLKDTVIRIDSIINGVIRGLKEEIGESSITIQLAKNGYQVDFNIKGYYIKSIYVSTDDIIINSVKRYKKNLNEITDSEYEEVVLQIIKSGLFK